MSEPSWGRIVIHADLDAFFASVEERDDPRLRGKPVIIGARPGTRGVVSTASYAARAVGVRSAMPISQAVALCPKGIFLPVDREKYLRASRAVFEVFARFADIVEQVSIDEAYLDVSMRAGGDPLAYARSLKEAAHTATGLVLSCGVAANKLVAKVASAADKPDGLVLVPPGSEAAYLAPFPARVLPGIGPKTETRLGDLGIETVLDLQRAPLGVLSGEFDANIAEHLRQLALGEDDRPVTEPEEPKQIGVQETYQRDLVHDPDVERALRQVCAQLVGELAASDHQARTITVRVRFADFTAVTRSRTLFTPSADARVIAEVAGTLLARLRQTDRRAIRLMGISAQQLVRTGETQLGLFEALGDP